MGRKTLRPSLRSMELEPHGSPPEAKVFAAWRIWKTSSTVKFGTPKAAPLNPTLNEYAPMPNVFTVKLYGGVPATGPPRLRVVANSYRAADSTDASSMFVLNWWNRPR